MNNELITYESKEIVKFTNEDIETVRNTVGKDLTISELKLFLHHCEKTNLDPMAKQIYAIKTKDKMNVMTSIDGLRLIAERSGLYNGQTSPEWCSEDGKWVDIWISNKNPYAARVGIYRKGIENLIYGIAYFKEYYSETYFQKRMPINWIAKVAEALALRKAFPNFMSGIYTEDEFKPQDESNKLNNKEIPILEDSTYTKLREQIGRYCKDNNCIDAFKEYLSKNNWDKLTAVPTELLDELLEKLLNGEFLNPFGE